MKRLLLAVALALLWPANAWAQDGRLDKDKLKQRNAKMVNYQGWVAMTVKWRDVVNTEIRRKLLSGLPTTIVTRAYVFEEGGDKPVALSAKTCRVVYDLWDEVFRIELRQGGRVKETVAVNIEGVLRRCAEARRLPITSLSSLSQSKSHFVGVLVEVNPLSQEMLDRIKRWVSRPRGAGSVGPGDSLFGSFVGLFITQVPDADKVVKFRTQAFVPSKLPEVKPPKPPPRSQRRRPRRLRTAELTDPASIWPQLQRLAPP